MLRRCRGGRSRRRGAAMAAYAADAAADVAAVSQYTD